MKEVVIIDGLRTPIGRYGGGLAGVRVATARGLRATTDEYGRFQIKTNDSHAFVLDTATGQVWSAMFLNPQFGVVENPEPEFHAPKISN